MLSQVEKAIYINSITEIYKYNKYSRIYYGSEFCEYLIPSKEEVYKVVEICKKRGLKLSFLTPYVTDYGIEKIDKILSFLSGCEGLEVVINDFGVLELIRQRNYKFNLCLGRLLNRQKRDPRIINFKNKLPPEVIKHFSGCYLDREEVINVLKSLGIERIEFDNLPQGLLRLEVKIKASLYYPYIYISTTRLCPARKSLQEKFRLRKIEKCNLECRKFYFILKNKAFVQELILKGNTYFLKWNKLPDNLETLGIDRIVFEPSIPI